MKHNILFLYDEIKELHNQIRSKLKLKIINHQRRITNSTLDYYKQTPSILAVKHSSVASAIHFRFVCVEFLTELPNYLEYIS